MSKRNESRRLAEQRAEADAQHRAILLDRLSHTPVSLLDLLSTEELERIDAAIFAARLEAAR